MDLGSLSAFITTLCLLGAVTIAAVSDVPCDCPCPQPPETVRPDLTQPPQAEKCCESSGKFRYTCLPGYLRKAGTSNLSRCKKTAEGTEWTEPTLQCIPDPTITTTTQMTTEVPTNASLKPRNKKNTEQRPLTEVRGSTEAPSHDTVIISLANDTTEKHQSGTGAIATRVSSGAALLVICVLLGLAALWWKRRWQQQPSGSGQTAEEQIAMNPEANAPSGPTCTAGDGIIMGMQ